MELKKVAAFRELPYGDKDGPSLRECMRPKPQEAERKIIRYLKNGIPAPGSDGMTRYILDQSNTFVACPHLLTDGIWAWYADLAYYVEKYHVRLPDEFIEHMKMNNWVISAKETVDVLALELKEQ